MTREKEERRSYGAPNNGEASSGSRPCMVSIISSPVARHGFLKSSTPLFKCFNATVDSHDSYKHSLSLCSILFLTPTHTSSSCQPIIRTQKATWGRGEISLLGEYKLIQLWRQEGNNQWEIHPTSQADVF